MDCSKKSTGGRFSHGSTALLGPRPPHCWGFEITLRHTTLGTAPPDEWSARRRDLYLTIHNTHKRQTSMTAAGLEPLISASERPQTLVLDLAARVVEPVISYRNYNNCLLMCPKTGTVALIFRIQCTQFAHLRQQCHNSKFVIFQEKRLKVLRCYNFLSSGEFCKLRYDILPVKSASANVSFYTNNSKMPNFEF